MGAQKAASKAALPPSSTTRITRPITPAAFNVSNVMTQPLPDSRAVTARPFETPQRSSVKQGAKRKVTEMDKEAGRGFQANPIASSSQSQNRESNTGVAFADSQWQRSFSWPAAQPGPHIPESGPPFPPPFAPPQFLSPFSPPPPPFAPPPFLPPFSPHPTHARNMQSSIPPPPPSHTIDIPVADRDPPHPSAVPPQSFNRFSRWTRATPFGPENDSSHMSHWLFDALASLMSLFDDLFCGDMPSSHEPVASNSQFPSSSSFYPPSTSEDDTGLNNVPQLSRSDGTESIASISTGVQPVGSIRRRRRDSSPELGRERKKQSLVFARSRCLEYRLDETAADHFSQLDSDQRSIETFILLKAQLLAKSNETLLSKSYKAHVSDQVLVCLTCPSIPAYLKNAVDTVMAFVKESPEWFKLDRVTLHSMEKWRTIRTIVSNAMTRHRSDIKATIAASLVSSTDKNKPCKGAQDVMALVSDIVPEYISTDCSHYVRFAFLRQCYLKHRELQANTAVEGTSSAAGPSKKDDTYWKYVDDELQKANVKLKAKSASNAQAATLLKDYFDNCLKADLNMFPIRDGVLPIGPADLLPVQRAVKKFMHSVVI
ncbi:hypothetical protein BC835DRAFT_1417118 [Cytidiella melzeri]|nr:hypothetical protein BC835DRAFT_1417118 [Cytidiella melzeri]